MQLQVVVANEYLMQLQVVQLHWHCHWQWHELPVRLPVVTGPPTTSKDDLRTYIRSSPLSFVIHSPIMDSLIPSSSPRARLFSELGLLDSTLLTLKGLGFASMTPVQAATLPLFLGNKDVCVEACTGSGKTIAYIVPCVERLARSLLPLQQHESAPPVLPSLWPAASVGAVILSPTRELAKQIFDVCALFCADAHLPCALAVGGTKDVSAEVRAVATAGAAVLVATPGRLLDVLKRCEVGGADAGILSFKTLAALVLDEADTLLEMGFQDTLTAILERLPKQRRTGLFSATQTREVRALARAGMRNPCVVTVRVNAPTTAAAAASGVRPATQATPLALSNRYIVCENGADKIVQLGAALRAHAASGAKAIIFVLTCASVDAYARLLAAPGVRASLGLPDEASFPVLPLHGKMVPKKRLGNYAAFQAAKTGALLCTDVAARGIDVPDVSHIVQFDAPQDPSFFIHRVGRTARAGRAGSALLLLLPPEKAYIDFLAVRNVPISQLPRATPFSSATTVVRAMQAESVADRAVLEATTRAFVSFVRGYKEHVCRVIFSLDELDAAGLAASLGLVKMPKVDELRARKGATVRYEGVSGVRTRDIAYKDVTREAARQARMVANSEKIEAEAAARDARRDRAMAVAAAPAAAAPKRKRKHLGTNARMHEEWELLQREERLEKRLRKGLISKADFKKQMTQLNRDSGITAEEEGVAGLGVSDDDDDDGGGEVEEEEEVVVVAKSTKKAKLEAVTVKKVEPKKEMEYDDDDDSDEE
jgi:ATP-dependent RNA helicase DDX55/SPB4